MKLRSKLVMLFAGLGLLGVTALNNNEVKVYESSVDAIQFMDANYKNIHLVSPKGNFDESIDVG